MTASDLQDKRVWDVLATPTPHESAIIVAIVDRYPLMQERLAEVVQGLGGTVVWTASTAAEAKIRIDQVTPEGLLLGFVLADQSGARTFYELRKAHPYLWGVVVSSTDELSYRALSYAAGALGYLSRSLQQTELEGAGW